MAGLKEIRRRISSVKNTKQITRAMKLVSAAKLRRAQEGAQNGRAYAQNLGRIAARVSENLPPEYTHPLLEKRETIKRRLAIVISGERGLCGAYNTNIVKAVQGDLRANGNTSFIPVGRRTVGNARRFRWDVTAEYEGLSEDAGLWPIDEIVEKAVSEFQSGRCDEVVLYYTQFVSAMTQTVKKELLLPFSAAELKGDANTHQQRLAEFSPEPKEILNYIIPLLIKTKVRQAGLESKASEHAARMTAMDSATSNANDLIERLRLFYNRARQTSITRELIDIVGGAEALK